MLVERYLPYQQGPSKRFLKYYCKFKPESILATVGGSTAVHRWNPLPMMASRALDTPLHEIGDAAVWIRNVELSSVDVMVDIMEAGLYQFDVCLNFSRAHTITDASR
jgi:hypothetical protein